MRQAEQRGLVGLFFLLHMRKWRAVGWDTYPFVSRFAGGRFRCLGLKSATCVDFPTFEICRLSSNGI